MPRTEYLLERWELLTRGQWSQSPGKSVEEVGDGAWPVVDVDLVIELVVNVWVWADLVKRSERLQVRRRLAGCASQLEDAWRGR